LRLVILIVLIVGLAILGWQYWQSTMGNGVLTLSGTIEANAIHLAARVGGEVQRVYADEGDYVQERQRLIHLFAPSSGVNEIIRSPINGVVLERLVEPAELVTPGSTIIVVADLSELTLTVYVPEDHYGQILLGQTYPVTVDSFPGQTFSGRVSHIANEAEFTPRNVQTVEGRSSTVFAIELDLAATGGRLKPGMPADVIFETQ
jgi:multidrug resistance efflux pump